MDLTKSVGLAIHWHYTLWMLDSSLWLTACAQDWDVEKRDFQRYVLSLAVGDELESILCLWGGEKGGMAFKN